MPIQPTKTFELYKGKIVIDFYEGKHRYVVRGKLNNKGREYSPLSVTAITGVVDKSTALVIWATRLTGEFLKRLLAVGEAISHAAIDQAVGQHRIKKTEAGDTGTAVHNWIEAYIAGQKPEMPNDEKILNGIMAFLAWVKEHKVDFLESESIVYSKKYDYVGKMDVRIRLNWNGKKQVRKFADFKTNNWSEDKETGERVSRVYPEQRFQLAAYKNAWEEERAEDGGGRLLICIDKETGEFYVHDLETDIENKPDSDAYDKDVAAFIGCLAVKRRMKELETWA